MGLAIGGDASWYDRISALTGSQYIDATAWRSAYSHLVPDLGLTATDGFSAMDRNRDGRLSVKEFHGQGPKELVRTPGGQLHVVAPTAAFDILDKNGDGVLTKNEFQGYASGSAVFNSLDVNGDGLLTRQEFEGTHPLSHTSAFEMLDANGDQEISRVEMLPRY